MLGFTGTFEGKPISVQSVGMGGPSVAIYYTELFLLGATRLVRVGTAGGLGASVRMGDTIIAVSATPDDPTTALLTNGEPHAPTGSFGLVSLAAHLASEQGARVHVGPVVTSALFYDQRPGKMQRWRERGHLGVEMEVSVLYTLAAIHQREAVGLMTVSDLIDDDGSAERISDEELKAGVDQMMRIACHVAVSP